MNLRKQITKDVVEYIRMQLDGSSEIELLDKEEHDRTQIARCLQLFLQIAEANASEGISSDSQMLASIDERLRHMADVIVTREQYDAHLNTLEQSMSDLVTNNGKLTDMVTQLISVGNQLIDKAKGIPTESPADFTAEDTILANLQSQVANISTSTNSSQTAASAEIAQAQATLSAAPAATSTGSPTTSTTSTVPEPITSMTPAPVAVTASTTSDSPATPVTASTTAGT